ncbi:hypothetical protein L195_g063758, partial [Trifolium pratense]
EGRESSSEARARGKLVIRDLSSRFLRIQV